MYLVSIQSKATYLPWMLELARSAPTHPTYTFNESNIT